jgi:hypothetical protein
MPSFAELIAFLQEQNNLQDVRLIIGSLLGAVFSPLCTVYNTPKKERKPSEVSLCRVPDNVEAIHIRLNKREEKKSKKKVTKITK